MSDPDRYQLLCCGHCSEPTRARTAEPCPLQPVAILATAATFGCNQWAAKEPTP